ncbi:MAG: DUF1553 domain-containing protein [Planctomycetaceae bacterium]|nr:DUF1553 domain-containing protein [Planctomycetaceae bacterium]
MGAEAGHPVDFNRDVRRILTSHCLACHGPDANVREAGLRLDDRDAAVGILESGLRAVVPGDPESSVLIQRVFSQDPSDRMPPAAHGPGLNEAEKATLRQWIAEGASFAQHWSFVRPQPPLLPQVSREEWVRTVVDRFVLEKLEADGLEPIEEADPYRLCRRVTLDLTGVPPTIAEADAFANDPHPDAYDRLVDRLLASPAFGERWARIWLDLARYADSQGYAQDSERTIWRYRDWVIQAINDGMTFDEFTIQQIAGDLLPDPSNDQLIATAFHRNTMTNSEGGTNDEEFRNAAVVDRVNTTMEVWMGLTMACAQCHSHKYDPISQEDYFRFFAIVNQTQDADRPDESPLLSEYTPDQLASKAALQSEIADLTAKVARRDSAENEPASTDEMPLPEGPLLTRTVRIELFNEQSVLHLAEVQVFVGEQNVAVTGAPKQSSTAYGADARRAVDGNTSGDFASNSVTHTENERNPWWEVELEESAIIDRVVVWNRTDTGLHARLANWRVVLLDPERRPLHAVRFQESPEVSLAIEPPQHSDQFTDDHRAGIAAYLRFVARESDPDRMRLRQAQDELAAIKPEVATPIMASLAGDAQRKTHIQLRGNYRVLGDEVGAAFPAAFPSLSGVENPTRLDLARWLVSEENPLTSRVVVNRFWEQLFGLGLVRTSEDFGTQGEPPSHPELLDHLSVELMRHGWDTKWLLREIVTSSTYRQSSRTSAELESIDPENRLLARGPRFRLPAEMIRDQALAIGGLLSDKMLGPSVQPERPKLGLRAAFGGSTDWETSPGEDRYRRGLYTKWRRTAPYPSMVTFDAPSREFCTIRRNRTNTPLQALVTLNDPVYIEAAQGLARRVLSPEPMDTNDRIKVLFRSALVRPPTSAENEILLETLHDAMTQLQADPTAAEKLAIEPLGPAPEGVDFVELAAWTVLANVVLNLDETLARP